jgi:hypothetical protein
MSLTDLIEQAKTLAESLCEDTCSVVDVSSTNDGYGGQTESRTTVASDIPCIFEAVNDQAVDAAGQRISIISHKIYMQTNATPSEIKPDYEIVVDETDNHPEMTFVNPQRMPESYEALATVAAKLRL